MKLTRISKLRYRVFRDFSWPAELHAFARFNVIYGWNGCGKTTLSSLLHLVEKRAALNEGAAELEFDGSTRIAGAELASKPVPQVRVFNRDFVNATLSSTGGIAPIYFLGEDSVEKQKEVDRLRNDLAVANTQLASATKEKNLADLRLDDFCRDKAKVVKELLTTVNSQAYNNYDKRRLRQALQALNTTSAEAAILSEEQKAPLRSQKDAQPKASIAEVAAPVVDLMALTEEVDALITRSVVAQTLEELKTDGKLASWVQVGLTLHSGQHASDICRFCQQPFEAGRRAALEAHFNDAFASFQSKLATLVAKLKAAQRSVNSLALPDASRFYDALTPELSVAAASVASSISSMDAVLSALIEQVEAKRDRPFESVPASKPIAERLPSINAALATFNVIVEAHNKTTARFKASVEDACKRLEASYVAEVHAEFLKLSGAVDASNTAVETLKGKPSGIEHQIRAIESQILEHQRPADELTRELSEYLGRDELRFEVKGTGYALTRNGQAVAHLSEGERTAIAFLYFLKSLQDKTFDMERGIVVVDDPVSSLDANALFSAFGYMKERTKACGQLFIFTHSFPFFRLVKNWFHYLPGQKKSNIERRPGRFFLLRSMRHTDGVRTSQLMPLDPLLQEYESEYQYLFRRVYDEAHRSDVATLEHHYGLPNVARRLLEAFLAFRFPDLSGDLGPRLDRVAFDNARKTRILRLLNTYSHAGAITEPEHDLSLLAETQPVLLDLLEMMRTADEPHYRGLERLVAQPVSETAEER